MKYLILTLMLSFTSIISVNAQSEKPTSEQKHIINPIIDQAFTEWSENWSYDKYVNRSAKINSITIDEDYGDIVVYGVFTYKRSILGTFEGTFSAKISNSGNLVYLKYTDADGLRGSKSF